MKRLLVSMLAPSCLLALAPTIAAGQQPAAAAPAADLAKKLSNPISDLVSVPLQFNWQQHVGPLELSQFILNFQPVMPFELNKNWNLIARVIMPFISQPPFVVSGEGTNGIGDIDASFFFSPKTTKGGFTWGVGPIFALPASYQPTIGSGHWSIGPTGVALQQTGKWTIGALVNQVWSVAGDDRREDVNQMFLEPFVAYQATHTVTLTIQSESTADWEADEADTDTWTIPINFEVAKLSTFGHFPASYQFGVGRFVAHPDNAATWKIRAAIIILLPVEHKP